MNRLALLFPGQGSQYIGMGKRLYSQFPQAKLVFEEASDILAVDLAKLCFEGSLEDITRTDNAQPAIFTASVAAFKAFNSEIGIEPHCYAGHSLGEYSALCCSGAINFPAAFKIVQRRGALMHAAAADGEGAMAAIGGIDYDELEELCNSVSTAKSAVGVACHNSHDQLVISGHAEAVHRVGDQLKADGAHVTFLKVGAAFHSQLMLEAAQSLREEIDKHEIALPISSVISNVTAKPYTSVDEIKESLVRQMHKPVRWQETMQYIYKAGVRIAIELGPKNVLKNLCTKNIKHVSAFAYDKEEDKEQLLRLLATKDKGRKLNLLDYCLAAAVTTVNYGEDCEEYRKGVVEEFSKLGELQYGEDHNLHILKALCRIFDTKRIPIEVQKLKVCDILHKSGLSSLLDQINI